MVRVLVCLMYWLEGLSDLISETSKEYGDDGDYLCYSKTQRQDLGVESNVGDRHSNTVGLVPPEFASMSTMRPSPDSSPTIHEVEVPI